MGTLLSDDEPLPSLPDVPLPHPQVVPSVLAAITKFDPAETVAQFVSVPIRFGAGVFPSVVPCPVLPDKLFPHVHNEPSVFIATANLPDEFPPAETDFQFVSVPTRIGLFCWVVSPLPSWLCPLPPHAQSVPFVLMATVKKSPPETDAQSVSRPI
jgi:hypothetical protein